MKKKVLIIEGHEGLRNLMSIVLAKNYQVYAVADGFEALAWLSNGVIPNVIIAESSMNGLALDDFLQTLQTSGLYAHIPVVLTDDGAVASKSFQKYYKHSSVGDFVSLPLRPAELIYAIARITATSNESHRSVPAEPVLTATPVLASV